MTQKELSYIEDCLGHLKTMEDLLNVSLGNLKNAELKNFVSQELKNTRKHYDTLYSLLEVKQYG